MLLLSSWIQGGCGDLNQRRAAQVTLNRPITCVVMAELGKLAQSCSPMYLISLAIMYFRFFLSCFQVKAWVEPRPHPGLVSLGVVRLCHEGEKSPRVLPVTRFPLCFQPRALDEAVAPLERGNFWSCS